MSVPFFDLQAVNARYAEALKAAAARVIDSGWYILGAELEAFEREFADYCGVRHALGVGNGLDALALILRAYRGLGALREGDEVIVPANTFIATFLAVSESGLVPVPVEPDPLTFNLDPAQVEQAIGPRTRAIIAVHLYGQLAEMPALAALARRRGLLLIEDAAQAHGASLDGCKAGAFGDAAAFSFFPTKNLGALGDGGAVTTDDDALATRVRQLRQYGWKEKYNVGVAHGRNSRLDEMQAALLRLKLPLVDGWNARRRDIAARYGRGIRHPAIEVPPLPGPDQVAHLYVVRSERRDELRAHLARCGVGVDVHYPIPDHRQPVFGGRHAALSLPAAERLARTSLSLPCFAELDDDEVDFVIDACNRWDG